MLYTPFLFVKSQNSNYNHMNSHDIIFVYVHIGIMLIFPGIF